MNKTTNRGLLITAVILGTVTVAAAQPPTPTGKNMFVDVNFGAQPSSRTFSTEAFPVVYDEAAIIRADQDAGSSAFLDVTAGYRVWEDVSVAIGLTTTLGGGGSADVVGAIPHPVFFDARLESAVEVDDLGYSERSVHFSAMWTSPVTDKIDASVFAGPSFIKLSQDLVTAVDVPAGTQTFTPVGEQQTATSWGFHFGGDITYLVTPRIGAGAMLRIVLANADLPSVPDVDIAGFQIAGGVRFRF